MLKHAFSGKTIQDYDGVPGHKELEKLINKVYTTYGPMNHKKNLHLKRFIEQRRLGEKHLKFKKIFDVRWAASTYEAALRLANRYDILMSHLQLIIDSSNKEWSKNARQKAQQLRDDLNDENFLILLNFQIDVLSHMALQSLFYQKSAASVIGEFKKQKLFTERLKELAKGKSDNLARFLHEVKCTNNANKMKQYLKSKKDSLVESCDTIEKYEASTYKAYKGHRLYIRNSEFETLSSYLEGYVSKLVDLHEKYMFKNSALMEQFDEMDHRDWIEADQMDGEPIIALGKYFRIDDYKSLGEAWVELKQHILNSNFFCSHKSDNPKTFWSLILQDNSILMPPNLRRLIQTVLVLATNSGTFLKPEPT